MIQISKIKNIFKFWIPAIVWLAIIFSFSSEPNLTIGSGGIEFFVVRKIAHICEFGILSFLILLPLAKSYGKKNYFIFPIAFLLTVFVALSDEFHQTFILGRNGNLKDVLIDSLGASLFLQISAFIIFARKRIIFLILIVINLIVIVLVLFMITKPIIESNEFAINEIREKSSQESGTIFSSEEKLDVLSKLDKQNAGLFADENVIESENLNRMELEPEDIKVPEEILLSVPFSSQAPFGIWDEVHEEACEEMSLIMVKYYLDEKVLTPEIAEDEIQRFKDYQLKRNGHFVDSNMEELSVMASDYFDLKDVFVKYEITESDIKKSLLLGKPVIIPTAGRLLKNPNFSGLGPLYHNLVIIGFDGDEFITNDPGTRRGEGYRYKISLIMDAIHDYQGNKSEIEKGSKTGLFFTKE